MSGRKKFITSIMLIIAAFMIFIILQAYNLYSDTAKRTPENLLNQYYRLLASNPEAAKRALELILQQDAKNHAAMREMGFWYLRQGDTNMALKQFKLAQKEYPYDKKIAFQLKAMNEMLGARRSPTKLTLRMPKQELHLTVLDLNRQPIIDLIGNLQLGSMMSANPTIDFKKAPAPAANKLVSQTAVTTTTIRNQLLNAFYQNRVKDIPAAWSALHKLLLLYPNDLVALKEAGYYALGQDKKAEAAEYFKQAYEVSHDPYLAMQEAYILTSIDQNRLAYHYFDLATNNPNLDERLKAEIAKTNLRGMQTRFLPENYFADLLFYPFYRSRFKLLIYPLIARAGVVLNKEYQIRAYLIYRRTSDNKSSGSGVLPQIFEDNVAITSFGLSAMPIKNFPMTFFAEAGKAVDLVYRDRARWRNDFRAGLVYYNEWGKQARYTFTPTFTLKPNADLYIDAIYFSRFLNNIGTMRLRPGIELLRFGSTSFNFYWKVFLSQDSSRIFYNNFVEEGPSLAFTPSDRYNIVIRYECLNGYYLKSGGQFTNPYATKYHNNMIFLDTFIGI